MNTVAAPPREREVRRALVCLCGEVKAAGVITCPKCWTGAPRSIFTNLHRSSDRFARRAAGRTLMEWASRRNRALAR